MNKNYSFISIPKYVDRRGVLAFAEFPQILPFSIKRIYYLYDVPTNMSRGVHAHKTLKQVLIPITGSFSIYLDDGINKDEYHLSDPSQALYIKPVTWRVLSNFSHNAVCLVLASETFDANDYIGIYDHFQEFVKNK